jgi:F-type H+-transporting ATPase subunit epsilon
VTLHVELLMPDRSLWSGEAGMVIAKTTDGDIGIQTGHSPVFGILSPGSIVRIREVPGDDSPGDAVRAAVRDGFLSVTNDRVSILASVAQLSTEVDTGAARDDLQSAASEGSGAEESPEYRYARAQLLAAGEQA